MSKEEEKELYHPKREDIYKKMIEATKVTRDLLGRVMGILYDVARTPNREYTEELTEMVEALVEVSQKLEILLWRWEE